jgi:hypothetical protein
LRKCKAEFTVFSIFLQIGECPYMHTSYLACITINKLRHVRISGFLMETLSPNPQCMQIQNHRLVIIQCPRRPVTDYQAVNNTAVSNQQSSLTHNDTWRLLKKLKSIDPRITLPHLAIAPYLLLGGQKTRKKHKQE